MDYKYLHAKVDYTPTMEISRITILVEISPGDVRAIFANNIPKGGYTFLTPLDELNNDLLYKVASCGQETIDRDEIFPGWKEKYKFKNLL